LFAVACGRRLGGRLIDEELTRAIDLAERYAEGEAEAGELRAAHESAQQVVYRVYEEQEMAREAALDAGSGLDDPPLPEGFWPRYYQMALCQPEAVRAAEELLDAFDRESEFSLDRDEAATRAELLRCIVGNPFRRVAATPSWLAWNGGTVVQLAQTIYEDRWFERMSILGDALEAASCHNATILGHCRGAGPHVRGCWVLDLLLNKS
jgi:hypothetical protein